MPTHCGGCTKPIDLRYQRYQRLAYFRCEHLMCQRCVNMEINCQFCTQSAVDKMKNEKAGKTPPKRKTTTVGPIRRAVKDYHKNVVFVANLPYSIEEWKLQSLFSMCGFIEDTRVHHIIDSNQVRRSYGFIQFQFRDSANKAKTFDGKVYRTFVIQVMDASSVEYSLSLTNLPTTVKNYELKRLFKHHDIRSAVCEDGCGTVTFKNDADRRMAQETRLIVHGNVAKKTFNEPPIIKNDTDIDDGTFTVRLEHMPKRTTKEQLNTLFTLCGKIKDITILSKKQKLTLAGTFNEFSTTYALVSFSTREARDFALTFDKWAVDGWNMSLNLREGEKLSSQLLEAVPVKATVSTSIALPNRTSNDRENFLVDNFSIQSIRDSGIPLFDEDDFYIGEDLGHGSYGFVCKATNPTYGLVAVKTFHNSRKKDEEREIIQIIMNSNHPNIVNFVGVLVNTDQTRIIGYAMEYMDNNSVFAALHEHSFHIDISRKYSWISQAALALAYLHKKQIIHRDVKPANMLLKSNYNHLCICDMGTTRGFDIEKSLTEGLNVGTLKYIAPEMIRFETRKCYDKSVDVYSMAITSWEILTQLVPFHHIDQQSMTGFDILACILSKERPKLDEITDDEDKLFIQRIGSYIYCAPEVTLGKTTKYNVKLDIYSFAINMWEIITRREPFDHITEDNSLFELAYRAAKNHDRPEKSMLTDRATWELLERSWDREPCKRPTADAIVMFFDEALGKTKAEYNYGLANQEKLDDAQTM